MFVVYDLETTGFSSSQSDVIQFSYIRFDNNRVAYDAGTLYFYYEGMSWSEEAYNVHKIPLDFLKQFKDDFRKNVIKMWTILSGANVVGHNSNKFDNPFATNWLARMGCPGLMFGIMQDTMLAFRPMTHTAQVSLIKLCELNELTPDRINSLYKMWFGVNEDLQSHNASYDVAATAMLALIALNKKYMSFDAAIAAEYVDVDMSLLDNAEPPNQVNFELIESDGSIREHTFDGHKMGNFVTFPIKLKYVSDNRYESDGYTLWTSNPNRLELDMLGVTLVSGKDFDVLEMTNKMLKNRR